MQCDAALSGSVVQWTVSCGADRRQKQVKVEDAGH